MEVKEIRSALAIHAVSTGREGFWKQSIEMHAETGVVWRQAVAIPAPLHNISTSLSQFRAQISLQREGALLGMAQQSQNMAWVSGWVETTGVGLNSSVIISALGVLTSLLGSAAATALCNNTAVHLWTVVM